MSSAKDRPDDGQDRSTGTWRAHVRRAWIPVVLLGLGSAGIRVYMAVRLGLDLGQIKTIKAIGVGTVKTMAPVLVGLICLRLVERLANRASPWLATTAPWLIAFLTRVAFLAVSVTEIVDAIHFSARLGRVDAVLLNHLDRSAIGARFSVPQLTLITAGAIGVALGLWWLSRHVTSDENATRRSRLVFTAAALPVALVGTYALAMGRGIYLRPTTEPRNAASEARSGRIVYDAPVADTGLANLWRLATESRERGRASAEFSEQERAWLVHTGLWPTLIERQDATPGPVNVAYDRIVLLTVESLARDYLSAYNPRIPRGATPFLDRLVAKYPHLDNFYTSALPTDNGLHALYSSRLEFLDDLASREVPALETVFTALQKSAGFTTVFLRGNEGAFAKNAVTYRRMFKLMRYTFGEELASRGMPYSGWGVDDRAVLAEAVRILEEHRGDRIVLAVNTIDTHPPYRSVVPDRQMPREVLDASSDLLKALHSTDVCLKEFVEELERKDLLDRRTLVVLTADHSPDEGSEYLSWTGSQDYRPARIPLVFIARDLGPLARLDPAKLASQIDVAPTLLGMMNVPIPATFMGRDMLDPQSPGFAIGVSDREIFLTTPTQDVVVGIEEGDASALPVPAAALRKALLHRRLD